MSGLVLLPRPDIEQNGAVGLQGTDLLDDELAVVGPATVQPAEDAPQAHDEWLPIGRPALPAASKLSAMTVTVLPARSRMEPAIVAR